MYEVYRILDNDTLDSIAGMYGVDKFILRQINGLLSDDINNLEYLVVPNNKTPFGYYMVKKGDNIYNIAKNNDIDYQLLLKLNGLKSDDMIYPNQIIIIPKDEYKLYITKNGDTLSNIYNNDMKEFMEFNRNISISPEQIIITKK